MILTLRNCGRNLIVYSSLNEPAEAGFVHL